jgi:Flp pilus assembly protein TadD
MKKAATAIAACLLFALSSLTPIAVAEPYEDTPDAAARDPDYAAGKAAMEKKNWAEAVKRFHQAGLRDPDSADLHNYLGFSYRNLKQMDLAFRHYKRSIELNPRHRGAHEYIGEAYLMLNDLPSAEKHLAALRSICLLPCEELADLEKAVTEHRARQKRAAKP